MGYRRQRGNTRSRLRRRHVFALVSVSVTVLAVVLASCVATAKPDTATAQSVADAFVSALNEGDVDAAAEQTSYPNAAKEAIGQMFDGLDPKDATFKVSQFMDLGTTTSFFTMSANWNFGPGRDWAYEVQGSLRNLSVGWRISWDPAVVAPNLTGDRSVRYDRTDAAPPTVLDAGGGVLMNEQIINTIKLDPATMPDPADTTRRLADVLAPVAPIINAEYMTNEMRAHPGEQVEAVKLRDQDYNYLGPEKFALPGVIVERTPTLITADRRISTPLVDPYRTVWQANRDATAGWAVHTVGTDGTVIPEAGFQGPPGPDIRTTLDTRVQLAATEAVVTAGTPAAVVAIQPSTGAVLAAAQNNQAIEKGPIAFTGSTPSGNSLDLVRSAAGWSRGVEPKDVSVEDVEVTGHSLGLGRNYDIPGLEQKTAQFTSAREGMDQAMSQRDDDLPAVTPFGLAVLAASIARGAPVEPRIVQDQPATTDVRADALAPDVTERLRAAMRESAARGPEQLRAFPDLMGGGAQRDTDRWYFGVRGDLAFAVFVENADGGDRAVQMTDKFMQELSKPAP
ncbi:NTF2-like N-terminal transpeptidase domain-containing protein [Rhodococcus sp. HNM0569]|uniref:NTF2-like N-terminal transpeptidase domain-containing protein n=1 Tax=Rhodococcus sp. HNM0569 TaxID=2716340 RepID=UPI00146A4B73|nr:NTF2-like N-terminal transpeptidase domain-containing protein [Rhodococcus sp. HNM0569]NLU83722.1 penicillin-binding protein [Rhodococcus sp. HNM0569]